MFNRIKKAASAALIVAAFVAPAIASANCVCVRVCCNGGYACFCNQ